MTPEEELCATNTLRSARRVMEIARTGQRDYAAGAERRDSGLYQAVTSGRSVTFTLQNMRKHVPGFEEWYDTAQDRLKSDPVCKWFVEVRNRIEKRGDPGMLGLTISGRITPALLQAAPPGTKSFFIGDQLGRSGYIVGLPDGSETTIFTTLPPSLIKIETILEGAPEGRDLDSLLQHYLDALERLLLEAEELFDPGSNHS